MKREEEAFEGDGDFAAAREIAKRGSKLRPVKLDAESSRYQVTDLWYRLVRHPWSCLVVVSADRSPRTLRLARNLAELGTQHGRSIVEVIDATEVDLARAAQIADIMAPAGQERADELRFVIALDSPIVNPIAIGVLAACDAVVLLLEKGITTIPRARRIIEIVGRDRLVGAVLTAD